MQASWNKHGATSFTFGCVENCEADFAYEREQFFLDSLKPVFNSNSKAVMTDVKVPHRGISELYQKWCDQIVSILVYCKCLDEFCEFCETKAASKFFGIKTKSISPEVRAKMSAGAKFRHAQRDTSNPGRGCKGIPKPESHKKAQSDARFRYVARMREIGMWPPNYSKN